MLLQSSAERVLDFVFLAGGELDFPASVILRVIKLNGDLVSCEIVGEKNLDEIFGTALYLGYDRIVCSNEGRLARAGRRAHGTHREKLPCVEGAGVEAAWRFRPLVADDIKVGLEKDLALLKKF